MPEIPETVQCLLDFVNLGSELGKLNISKLETKPKIKRPPTKPPPGIMSLPDQNLPHRGLDLNIESTVDAEGNTWLRSFGETIFRGKENFCPPLKEFKDFFLRWGILPVEAKTSRLFGVQTEAGKALDHTKEIVNFKIQTKGGNVIYEEQLFLKEDKESDEHVYLLLKPFWEEALKAFHLVLTVNGSEWSIFQSKDALRIYNFCISMQGKGSLPFSHDGTLPFALYVYILDLWISHKKIHSSLKQCPCCGKFWVEDKNKKGRRKKYCSTECEDRFNQQSREKDISNKRRYRQKKYTKTKIVIVKWLTENHSEQNKNGVFRFVTKERAEEIYNDLPKKAKTSLKDFNKNWAKPRVHEMEDI